VRVLGVVGWLAAIGLVIFGYVVYDRQYRPALAENDALLRENAMFVDLVSELRGMPLVSRDAPESRPDMDAVTRDLEATLRDEIADGGAEVRRAAGRLSVTLLDDLLFESGEAELADEGKRVLDRLGPILTGLPGHTVSVEGHSDNVRIGPRLRERYPTNWELSAARATHVVRHFQNELDIDPERLEAVAYGAYRPVASNRTESGRAKNRRIEIVLIPQAAVEGGTD